MTRNEVVAILTVAVVYFCTGKLGLRLAFLNASATPIWAPTGISLAAVLLFGHRVWPGIWLGAFLVNITTAGSVLTAVGTAVGNTLEALCGAWLVTRFANGRRAFEHARDIFKFILLAGILSTTLSATLGVTSLALGGLVLPGNYLPVWVTWWLGDLVSDVIVAPLILIWGATPLPRLNRRQLAEAILMLCLVIYVGLIVFRDLMLPNLSHFQQSFLCFPPLLWAVFRFGRRGAIGASVALSGVALWGTLHGFGPFAVGNPNESLLLVQAFTGTITVTNLVLAAVIVERRRIEKALSHAEVEERTRLAGNLAITQILAESPALSDATPRILQTICETLKWEVGTIWTVDPDANALRCLKVWHNPSMKMDKFESASYGRTFAPGIGLPGRVWKSLKPAWIPDVAKDDNFPRSPAAAAEGLHAAFGFPIMFGEQFLGVMEFFSRDIREPDDALLAMFGSVGSQIGQFMERKQAEQAQAELAAIVESSNDPIISMSLDGIVTSWNRAAERTYGYSVAEMIGQSVFRLVPPDRVEEEKQILVGLRGGQPVMRHETMRVTKDGQRIPVSLSISPIRDVEGTVVGASKLVRDISERKQAEDALRRAAQFPAQNPNPILRIGDDEALLYANDPAKLFLSKFGWHSNDVLPELVRTMVADARQQSRFMEREICCPDGQTIWFTVAPFGNEHYVNLYGSDITARRHAEEALRSARDQLEQRVAERTAELQSANEELIRAMAEQQRLEAQVLAISEKERERIGRDIHDNLGQHLAGISFMTEALRDALLKRAPKLAKDAARIVARLKRSIDVTHDMAHGLFPIQLKTDGIVPALQALAVDVEEMFKIGCEVNGARQLQIQDETVARHLYRIAQEAAYNAGKHSHGKRIRIELAARRGAVTLTVQDDGKSFTNSASKAGGMGLRIMDYRAKMIGGTLDVRNSPGKGTTVTCTLKNRHGNNQHETRQ